jgi:hypothetical protein
MLKRALLLCALLFGLAGLASYGQGTPIRAEIKLARTDVRVNEAFLVSTSLRNASTEEQVLEVWACGYGRQWTADSPSVQVDHGEPCLANSLVKVKLRPGETYKRPPVRVTLAAGAVPATLITFRLGYQNELEPKDEGTQGSVKTAPPRIWSNAVRVSVTR